MNLRPLVLAAALGLLGAAGCADNKMSLETYGICGMPETCSFSGKCDGYNIGAIGYFSAAGSAWLTVALEMHNQAPNNADAERGRVNSNDAHITGMRLEIDGPASGTIDLDVSNQAVPAEGTSVIFAYVLPPASVAALPSGTYTVDVIFTGYYDNGRDIETPAFPIAVEVDASGGTVYACPTAGDIISCGTDQQSLYACSAP
jgi:hypothetical protein